MTVYQIYIHQYLIYLEQEHSYYPDWIYGFQNKGYVTLHMVQLTSGCSQLLSEG